MPKHRSQRVVITRYLTEKGTTMSAGKDLYEERRRLEAENGLRRAQQEKDRLDQAEHANTIMAGVAGLFSGTYHIYASPENGGWYIQFRKN